MCIVLFVFGFFFFFKQKTAYEIVSGDWSSDVCSSDLELLTTIFGRKNVYVELQRHCDVVEERRNQAAVRLAETLGLPLLATNGVRYATAAEREILDVFTCIRNHCKLETAGRLQVNT